MVPVPLARCRMGRSRKRGRGCPRKWPPVNAHRSRAKRDVRRMECRGRRRRAAVIRKGMRNSMACRGKQVRKQT